MSNSIAPGSSADVNVQVRALATDPNVSVQYKTVILKKNLVNGVNTLTQEMMNQTNTKYVIKYDYVLGENIIIPADCILEFDGGSISGDGTGKDTITGTNTGIQAGLVKIFNTNVTLAGTWNVAEAYPEWFGAIVYTNVQNDNVDSHDAIQAAIDFASNCVCVGSVKLNSGYYKISNPLKIYRNKNIVFGGVDYKTSIIYTDSDIVSMITTDANSYVSSVFKDFSLFGSDIPTGGISFDFSIKATYGLYFPNGYIYSRIANVRVKNCGTGLYVSSGCWGITISGCNFSYSDNGIDLITALNGITIQDCEFSVLKSFGFQGNGRNIRIVNNLFEIIGGTAILFNGFGIKISGNYFEQVCITGVSAKTYNNTALAKRIKATVFQVNQPGGSNIDSVFSLANANICIADISCNTVQQNIDDDSYNCFCFGTAFEDTRITNNQMNRELDLFGSVSHFNSAYNNNVDLSANKGYGKLIASYYNSSYQEQNNFRSFCNIYTIGENKEYNGALDVNFLELSSSFVFQNEFYNGRAVYSNSNNIYVQIPLPINGYDENDVFEFEMYRKIDGTFQKFVYNGLRLSTPYISYRFYAGYTYTLPVVRRSGSRLLNDDNKVSYAKKGTLANKPQLDSSTTFYEYFATDKGTNGAPIYWNGTAWVDATGTTV